MFGYSALDSLRQGLILTVIGLKTLPRRIKGALVIVTALIAVSAVQVTFLSVLEGLSLAYAGAGDPNNAVVLDRGVDASIWQEREGQSEIPSALFESISRSPGIARMPNGSPLADAEVYTNIVLLDKPGGILHRTGLRGIGPVGFALLPGFKLISGRMPRPGQRELITGVSAQRKFSGLESGDLVPLRGAIGLEGDKGKLRPGDWRVVGVFFTGNIYDGDLLTDSALLMSSLQLGSYNSVIVRIASPDSLTVLKNALSGNSHLLVERQPDYWRNYFESLPKAAFNILFYTSCILVGVGALTGIVQTMNAVVDSRAEEMAMLRAIGFGSIPLAASVVLEATLLAAVGAMIGTAVIWRLFEGYAYRGPSVFRVTIDSHLLMLALAWALLVAFIGALLPAIRAARGSVIEALRGSAA